MQSVKLVENARAATGLTRSLDAWRQFLRIVLAKKDMLRFCILYSCCFLFYITKGVIIIMYR
jgi:hypothetical protein